MDTKEAIRSRSSTRLERQTGEVACNSRHIVYTRIDYLVPTLGEEQAENDNRRQDEKPDQVPLEEAPIFVLIHMGTIICSYPFLANADCRPLRYTKRVRN